MAQQLLISLQELATLTSLPAEDPRLALAAKRASGRFYADTNRETLLASDDVETANGTGGPVLLLRGAPVRSITKVLAAGQELAEHVGYRVDRRAGILERVGGDWPRGLGTVEVTYRHGYDEVPDDIADAVLEHAATIAKVAAYLTQEGGGATQAAYAKEATVGTTAKWVAAVERYNLARRS